MRHTVFPKIESRPPTRVLIVDDETSVHDSYRCSFASLDRGGREALATLAEELFGPEEAGDTATVPVADEFACVHHHQGLDAVAEIDRSIQSGDRFAVAFIDVRMPPGIDGKETARRIRAIDPDINIVIVTGFSDASPLEITRAAGPADKIFYLSKPFEVAEIVQMATALSHRWRADHELAETRAALADKIVELERRGVELAANESRARHIANHDPLTEAPNRLAFLRALKERTRGDTCFATAMLDLDRFKAVNDTLGHLVGDELLRAVYRLLSDTVPECGMVARLGGDEFGILFDTEGADAAVMICDRMLSACAVTMQLFGHMVQSNASIGVVVSDPELARDPVDVMRSADLALNHAKHGGRGTTCLYDDSMDESIRFRRRIEEGLANAIERDELRLVYQPIVALDSFEITGFEALVRWTSPEFGSVSPSQFIPIAEDSNFIHDLGDWVLHATLAELRKWPGLYISVNFSPRQFRRHNFVAHMVEAAQRHGIEPQRLQIEITETAIFDDADRAAETLYRLRQMGFRIALDDFGTGYSSLYNIRKFALDALKIDRSFIDGMGRERESGAIVHSIIHLGGALGLEVVAEGLETEAQLQALRDAGASHLQGYLLSRPVDAETARAMAHKGTIQIEPTDGAAERT